MRNPWLDIPLDDYEGHMVLPQVAQAKLLADTFEELLIEFVPGSVAVLGCAGGNGFERISPSVTARVVGIDLNPKYIEAARARFQDRFRCLEFCVGDIRTEEIAFAPVDFLFAALVFEYIDPEAVWRRASSFLRPEGIFASVVQLPTPARAPVTPSPFASVQALSPHMRLVPPEQLRDTAKVYHYAQVRSYRVESRPGKSFQIQVFRREAQPGTDSQPCVV